MWYDKCTMLIKTIKEIKDLQDKVVLVRCDFNVPLKAGKVAEDYKLKATLPTLQYLRQQGAKLILMTHLGQPEISPASGRAGGKIKQRAKFSTKVLQKPLAKLLKCPIEFVPTMVGQRILKKIDLMPDKGVLLLENLRFEPGEQKNSRRFAKQLAALADIYVNDAFAVCHRRAASVSAIKKYLPSFSGLLLTKELTQLQRALQPKKPLVVVIGGIKLGNKVEVIRQLSKIASKVLLGGVIANNWLTSRGVSVGKSLIDKQSVRLAKKLDRQIGSAKIILPIDAVVASGRKAKLKAVEQIGSNDKIKDIGPKTMRLYADYLKKARTIIWNGPLGQFEEPIFAHGSLVIGRIIAVRSQGRAFGVCGGGETIQVLRQTKMFDDLDWVSTGGGAMLQYLAGKPMPGLKKLVK